MAIVSACIYVSGKESAYIVEPMRSYEFKLKLSKNREYLVGIDQSTSCTGIFITDSSGKQWILIDFKRDDNDKDMYFRDLKGFLASLFQGARVSMIIHEEPVPAVIAPTANAVLTELRGKLRDWIAAIPELNLAELHSVYPQTWKNRIVNKKSLKGRDLTVKQIHNSKDKMSAEICRILPFLSEYRERHYASDYDSFDAAGILLGYLKYSRTPNGRRKICGTIEKRHSTIVFYQYVDRSMVDNIAAIEDLLGGLQYSLEPTILLYNTEYSREQNIKMASSNWDNVVTYFPEKQTMPLLWEFGLEYDANKIMMAFIFRKGHLRTSELNQLKSLFPHWEEV